MQYPNHLLKVIQILKKLPGVGSKSAERFAFELLDWSAQDLNEASTLFATLLDQVKSCTQCGCLMSDVHCSFCQSSTRDRSLLCIIASARDAFAVEQTREYKGIYHVLGGVLSPLQGIGPQHLNIPSLKNRIAELQVKEVIIGLDSTLEGDATSLYLKKELEGLVVVSRLAFGLPMGSALEYVDGGTLARAFSGRRHF